MCVRGGGSAHLFDNLAFSNHLERRRSLGDFLFSHVFACIKVNQKEGHTRRSRRYAENPRDIEVFRIKQPSRSLDSNKPVFRHVLRVCVPNFGSVVFLIWASRPVQTYKATDLHPIIFTSEKGNIFDRLLTSRGFQ